ncbi:MAG: YegS/Rv2252/BmrU family lipid kinase [Sphaerochaetaceae bacterium]
MGTSSPLFIVLNPNAAKGGALQHRQAIENYFLSRNIEFVLALTECRADGIRLAKEATIKGFKTIIAAGGDGTLNEIVDGITRAIREKNLSFEEAPVVGQIPIGRGNDFAFVAKIPQKLEEACQLILDGRWLPTDYGELFGGIFPQGRCFVNGVGIGVEPQVNFIATDFKRISGMLSYLVAFLKILRNFPTPMKLKVVGDNNKEQILSQQFSICNGRRMGSAFLMAPDSVIDDGLLNVVYANRPIKKRAILYYVLKFFAGTQLKTDRFSQFLTTQISVEADGDVMAIHCDGEEVSRGCSSLTVKVFPKQLKVIRKM